MNLLIITGNAVKDAELRYTPDQKPVLGFTVANNQGFGEKQRTEYYDCALWGKRAESLAQYITKGGKLTIHGEHRTEKREHNGKEYFNNKVFVREIELSGKSTGQQQGSHQQASQVDQEQQGEADFDDDIPF